jgi:thioredoxin-like negative regulator of GroEL
VNLVKVNVDINTEASAHYKIQAMPTFLVLDSKGEVILSKTGGSNPVVDEIVAKAAAHK